MPYLGDYIGYLLSEITNARAQADYEAVRLAEFYARDPYLKHIPIPRFRMPTVNLDVPVVINNVEQPEKGKYSNDQALSYMQQRLRKLLPVQVKKISSLKIDKSRLDTISRLVDDEFEKFKQNDSIPIRITYIADRLVSGIIGELEKYDSPHQKTEEDAIKRLGSELRNQLYTEFSKYLREQPRLDITANTADLKNAGTKDILAYLRFTITEEAFEWDVVEEDKNIKRRLLPE